MDPARLTDLQLDALREVTNIGCGAAATALSQLLGGRRVEMAVTRSHVIPVAGLARHLDGIWKLGYWMIIVPRPLRDVVYRFIARHRYRLGGKRDACMVPTPDVRARFLT